jgi:uncharacterized protein YndB with AHSA1/START domain
MKIQLLFVPLALMFSTAATAAVKDESPNGFTVEETTDIAASPALLYQALIAPERWWNRDHTYSHDAANLSLDARAGGCWCETLPNGGSVQHLVVVNAIAGKILRLRGALGPLQGMAVDGAMTFSLRIGKGVTQLTLTYTVGGYAPEGFDALAKAVDSVLGEQTARLKRFVETGSPDPSKQHTSNGESP